MVREKTPNTRSIITNEKSYINVLDMHAKAQNKAIVQDASFAYVYTCGINDNS